MPLSAIIPPLIAAGSAVADNLIRSKGQKRANRENERLAKEQRNWSEKMWHEQNAYNHPQMQMARLKAAGLNPNLVYGSGSVIGTAGDVKGYDRSESKNVQEGFNAFSQFNQLRNLNAQINNIEAQTQTQKQLAIKAAYESLNTAVNTKQKTFDLGLSKDLRDTNVQAAQANAYTAVENARKANLQTEFALKTQNPRIQLVKTQVHKALEDLKGQQLLNRLRQLEGNLNKYGIQKSDAMIMRLIMQSPIGKRMMDSGYKFNLK